MKQNWFGYVGKKDYEVVIAVYSYWEMYKLKQQNYYAHIIAPFEADGYNDALKKAERLKDKWFEKEVKKLKEV